MTEILPKPISAIRSIGVFRLKRFATSLISSDFNKLPAFSPYFWISRSSNSLAEGDATLFLRGLIQALILARARDVLTFSASPCWGSGWIGQNLNHIPIA